MKELLYLKINNISLQEFLEYVPLNREPINIDRFYFSTSIQEHNGNLEVRINVNDPERFHLNPLEKCFSILGKAYYNIARYFIREAGPSATYESQTRQYGFEFKLNLWSDTLTKEEAFVRHILEGLNYEVVFSNSEQNNVLSNTSLALRKTCGLQKFFSETFNLLMYVTGDNYKYHNIRQRLIAHELSAIDFDRLLDLGCGHGQFIYEKHQIFLNEKKEQEIIGVELDEARYKEAVSRSNQLPSFCKLKLINGDITAQNPEFSNYDTIVLIEVIEHLFGDQLKDLEANIFQNIRAKNIFISTPNSDYSNYTEKIYDNGFRHIDHKFEWGKSEFIDWAQRLADLYNYKVYYYPMGIMDTLGATVSQMVYFSKS